MIIPWIRKAVHDDPLVRRYVQEHIRSPQTFVARIDEDDEMFLYGLKRDQDRRRSAINYFAVGSAHLRRDQTDRRLAFWRSAKRRLNPRFCLWLRPIHPVLEASASAKPHLGVRHLFQGGRVSEALPGRQRHRLGCRSRRFSQGPQIRLHLRIVVFHSHARVNFWQMDGNVAWPVDGPRHSGVQHA